MAGSKRNGTSTEQGNRSRSFGGCATCRSRHIKCDEVRPTCRTCSDARLSCGGYEKSVFFQSEEASSNCDIRFRRPLFTETERAYMSKVLTTSVPPMLALWHIEQIDEESESASRAEDFEVHHGCFGAFRLVQEQPHWTGDVVAPESAEGIGLQDERLSTEDCLFSSDDLALTPRTRELFQSILEEPLPMQNLLPPAMQPWSVTQSASRIEEIFNVEFSPFVTQQLPQCSLPAQDLYYQYSLSQMYSSGPHNAIIVNPTTGIVLPEHAVHLLQHYTTTVLKILTPFQHSKTPWHVLFVPHIKSCLAALTLGEALDHASLCAFYGILAVSAFSLHGLSGSSSWLEIGKMYKQRARQHARPMLQSAYDIPKSAKYKSILMALLTMVQVAMASGDVGQTDCYFLEAEKFIRVKGLNRKKSRKVRLLHHCYVFERMFHESIFLADIDSNHRSHVRQSIESSGAAVYSADSLTFGMSSWSNLAEAMVKVKGKEEGLNDLHIQLPGAWAGTLYPEIFGVPESYLFLLSVIIRLGKQKDLAEHQEGGDTLSLGEFLSRAKAVERCINQLRRPYPSNTDLGMENSQALLNMLMNVMQDALAIYFYRRIYDVEASILQPKVETVRDCLLRFECVASDMAYGAVRFIWPAFIAGCEAEDLSVRTTILDWLDRSAARSGSRLFGDTRANMTRIWAQKDASGGSSLSWVDLMKNNIQYVGIAD